MPRTSSVPIQAKPAMPAKTVFRPVESSRIQGLFIDNSFEANLLRETGNREFPAITLQGAPLGAVLGPLLKTARASSDSAPEVCPEGHPQGRLMIRNEIMSSGSRMVIASDQVYAVCQGTIYRLLGVTTKEAAYTTLGIAACKPQVFSIERFASWARTRFMYAVVHDRVYQVVNFTSSDEKPAFGLH